MEEGVETSAQPVATNHQTPLRVNTSMSENLVKYWKTCIDCICTCGGRRRHRIHPSDPRKVVIPVNNLGDEGQENQTPVQSTQQGETNPTFEPDTVDQINEPGNNNDSFDFSRNGSISSIVKEDVYLVIGDGKYIRVIHVKPLTGSNFIGGPSEHERMMLDLKQNGHLESHTVTSEEEEDSYWFSNWSRKPRFRSIFEKNTVQRMKSLGGQSGTGDPEFDQAIIMAKEMRKEQLDGTSKTTITTMYSTVEESPSPENNLQEEYNSIDICDVNVQKWSRCGKSESVASGENGRTNLGFEDDDDSQVVVASEQVHVEMHEINKKQDEDELMMTSPRTDVELESFKSAVLGSSSGSSVANNNSNSTQSVNDLKESPNSVQSPSSFEEVSLHEDNTSSRKESLWMPKKPLLFFIHGLCGSSDVWSSQMEFFERAGYEMVLPDLIGHGMSSCPSNGKHYVFEALVQDLITIFDHFVTEGRKVVLICHGYGAPMGALLTRVRPKQISLFISISGGGPTPLVRPECCGKSWLPLYCRILHTNKRKGRFDNPELRKVIPENIYRNLLSGQVWPDGDPAFYRRITVPTLLVYGMRDKVVNLVEECEMERTITKSFLELIETAGHMVMWDEPKKLNKMLFKFIETWS